MNYGMSMPIPQDGNCPMCHQAMKAESDDLDGGNLDNGLDNDMSGGGSFNGGDGGDDKKRIKMLIAIIVGVLAVLGIAGAIAWTLLGGKAKPEGVTLNKQVIELTVGDTETLQATVTPAEAAAEAILQWQVDGNAVSVSGGQVTAQEEGTATVTVLVEGAEGVKAFCVVNVKPAPEPDVDVETLTATEATAELLVDSTKQLVVTMTPANSDETIEWSSSNENIAVVDAASGMVTAKGEGVAVVTAKTSRTGKTAAIAVTVKKPEQKKEDGKDNKGGKGGGTNTGGGISVLNGNGIYSGGISGGKPHGNGVIHIRRSFSIGDDYIPAGSRIEGVFREGWVNLGTLFTPDGDAVVIKDLKVK
jgi:hypothetical protein